MGDVFSFIPQRSAKIQIPELIEISRVDEDPFDFQIFDEKLVLIGEDGAKWKRGENTAFIIEGKSWVNNHAHIVRTKNDKLIEEYIQLIFANLDFGFLKTRPNGGKLQKGEMMKIQFPLPDVETQKEIVNEVSKLKGNEKWKRFEELLK